MPIDLEDGVELRGRVVDAASGEPVASASVAATQVSDFGGMGGASWPKYSFEDRTVTAEDGRFDFPAVARPSSLYLGDAYALLVRVRRPGYVDAEASPSLFASDSAVGDVVVRLERDAPIEGTVLLPDGSPATEAEVFVQIQSKPQYGVAEPSARADARGEFSIAGHASGEHLLVRARAPQFADSETAEVVAGAKGRVTLRLRKLRPVRLQVTDAEGTHIEDCDVAVFDADQELNTQSPRGPSPLAITVGPGRTGFMVSAPGFASAFRWFDISDSTETFSMTLERPTAVEGVLVDDEGQPVGGQEVAVGPTEWSGCMATEYLVRRATSAADGTFRVDGIDPGDLVLDVRAGYHARVVQRVRAADSPVRIVLTRSGSLDVALVPPQGVPGPTYCGVYFGENGPRAPLPPWEGGDGCVHLGGVIANGRLRVDGIPPGVWDLEICSGDFLDPHPTVEIRPGQTTTKPDIRLDVGLSVEGRVLDPQGRPVPHLRVTSLTARSEAGVGDTDAEGRFRMTQLRPGPNTLVVFGAGVAARLDIVVGAATPPAVLVLAPTRRVTVHLRDAHGGAVLSGALGVESGADNDSWQWPDARGDVMFRLLPGRYEARFSDGSGTRQPAGTIEVGPVPDGEDRGAEVELRVDPPPDSATGK